MNRDFARTEPNRLWLTDITEHPTREGKVYCAAVLDVFSRRIVGWSIADHLRTLAFSIADGILRLGQQCHRTAFIGITPLGRNALCHQTWDFLEDRLRIAGSGG